jgi:Dockerin type I domain
METIKVPKYSGGIYPMKTSSSSTSARATLGTLLFLGAIVLVVFAFSTTPVQSADPGSGTIGPTGPELTWAGTAVAGGSTDESTCVDGVNCDVYVLTLSGTPADWGDLKAFIRVSDDDPTGSSDYDVYVHKGDLSGPIPPGGTSAHTGTPPEVVVLDPSDPNTGTGQFTVHVVYFSAFAGFQYTGDVSVASISNPTGTPPPAPQAKGPKVGFENFEAPGTLVKVTTSSQGPTVETVEYMGHDAGEPSIGVNWQSPNSDVGVTNFQSDLQTNFITFNDVCSTAPKATWYNSSAPTSVLVDSDPIGFTDPATGRVFAGELTLTSPSCKVSFTDTDGLDATGVPSVLGWSPSSGPLGSGIDHETIGGGAYHDPIPPLPGPYPHAVYYCSQDLVTAFCLRSDDGGATFGPVVATYTSGECGGLHGHVKVGPDGTVYLPNNSCRGTTGNAFQTGAVVVSEDNGITWNVRTVENATLATRANANLQDPAVAIDNTGRLYFGMSSSNVEFTAIGGSTAAVATSTDHGQTWQSIYDVGAALGLKNIAYPAATAGDDGRAAIAFYGSTTSGDDSANTFAGIWHLYVASTFDGGSTWRTVDVTPNAPLQRGCIWMHGGADICRNLLDFFDMTVDKQGRVEVGYVNGCAGGNCMQAAPTAFGNAYTATATIARQSSGKRMFAANDPASPTVPGMPFVSQRRVGLTIHLAWSEADTGNSPITGYQILRGIASNAETLLTTVTGTQTGGTFTDLTATDTTKTYYYKVLAINSVGASCGNNEIAAPYIGTGCTGLIVQKTPSGHPEQPAQGAAPASLAIDSIAVGEPPNSSNLLFQMKVTSLSGGLPANSRWRIVWDSYKSPGEQFYVGMQTDSNSTATFGYGQVMTGAIPPVIGLIGVPIETPVGTALPASNFQPNGTITIVVPKSVVGNPLPGDLLGAVNGRTFTGDTPQTVTLERSTLLIDHTFVKAQRDNGSPAATYTVLGNNACEGGIVPSVVSRKTHDSISPPFDIPLPLSGNLGIECRSGGQNGDFQMVATFATPIIGLGPATVSSGTGTVSNAVASGNQIFVNLTGVTNAQRITVTLSSVNDGINVADVAIPMGVLLGDVDSSGRVDATDVFQVRQNTLQNANSSNFRTDVDESGRIDSTDVFITRQQSLTSLP